MALPLQHRTGRVACALVALMLIEFGGVTPAVVAHAASGDQDVMLVATDSEAMQADGQAVDDTVDANRVAKDPVVYLSALDTIRAYFLAGQAAYQHNDLAAAGEMFLAPMEEVYVNLESVLLAQGVPTFGNAMINASDNAYLSEQQDETQAAITQVLDGLKAAETALPKSNQSQPSIQAQVLTDLLTRAATQYEAAFQDGSTNRTWLNGYGFYKAAEYRASIALPLMAQQKGKAHAAVLKALEILRQAYTTPVPPVIAPIRESEIVDAVKQASDLVGAP
jgi:hypothetical protein